jgi:hypothetical protein
MKHYLLCLVDTDEAAQEVTEKVTSLGFAKEEIFVFSSPGENVEEPDGQTEAADREGEPFGERIELLTGIGPTVVGGAGHFIGTGPTLDASDSGQAGHREATAFLGRFGLSEDAARVYQNRLEEGGVLIAVRVDQQKAVSVARRIFEEAHGQEISEV